MPLATGRRAHTGLVEPAASESATPATVERQLVVGFVSQGALGLGLAKGRIAHLTGVGTLGNAARRQECGGGIRRVLAIVLVVANRQVEFPLRINLEVRITK